MPNNNFISITINRKSIFKVLAIMLISTLLSGCQFINETFGKEYRMIDDFFEQLKADVDYTIECYLEESDFSEEEETEMKKNLEEIYVGFEVAKEEFKYAVATFDELQNSSDVKMDSSVFLEKSLLEYRSSIEDTIKTASNGAVELKSTEVDRGFLGSIWHFIRNHWLISLIILGVISLIGEKIGDLMSKK